MCPSRSSEEEGTVDSVVVRERCMEDSSILLNGGIPGTDGDTSGRDMSVACVLGVYTIRRGEKRRRLWSY